MTRTRLEAFSDAVIAIIMTIMVLELKVPHGAGWADLRPLLPVFCSYVLSFVYLGIYWNNHHHMLHAAPTINGMVLWANLHLLFWLSLVPFATAWMGENHLAPLPTAAYGGVMVGAGLAYYLLERAIIAHQGELSRLKAAVGGEVKGMVSVVLYIAAMFLANIHTGISVTIYAVVAAMWFIPDRRIESMLH